MTSVTYLGLALVAVILIISIITLARNKNIRQKLRLPGGVRWEMETQSDQAQSTKRNESTQKVRASGSGSRGVNLGSNNRFEDEIGNIAGHDITDGTNLVKEQDEPDSSGVDMGKENVFSKKIGNIAGHNIVRKQNPPHVRRPDNSDSG